MSSKSLTLSDWQKAVSRYTAGESSGTLAKELGVSSSTFHWKLTKMGIEMRKSGYASRKYTVVDENYFDRIDTPEKAYWLGLMGSDGSVDPKRNRFEIGLSGEEDRCVLEAFKKALGYTGPLTKKQPAYPGSKIHYRLTVSNPKLTADLIKHGVSPRKSLAYIFNQELPPELMRHYVRGYFDGDGHASFKKRGDFLVGLVGSKRFVDALASYLPTATGLIPHVEKSKGPNPATGSLKIGGNLVSLIFLDWLYRDATVYLPRKEAKYRLCCEVVRKSLSRPDLPRNLPGGQRVTSHALQCANLLGIKLATNSQSTHL